jgi:hypothetical protein
MSIAFSGIPLLLIYFLVPESPRWLLRKGRAKQANEVIRAIAKGYR